MICTFMLKMAIIKLKLKERVLFIDLIDGNLLISPRKCL